MELKYVEKIGKVMISLIGVHCLYFLLKIMHNLITMRQFQLKNNPMYTGCWAIVTGVSAKLGRAFAVELAKCGLNLVLIDSDEQDLKLLQAQIEASNSVKARFIVMSLQSEEDPFEIVRRDVQGLDIAVLVNALCVTSPHPEYFLDLPRRDKIYNSMISTNLLVPTKMCWIAMHSMLEKGRGVIVNVSSTVAHIPSPLLAVYAASMAYIEKFSRDLASEYSSRGILVQCLVPGYIETKMAISSAISPSAETYAQQAIANIGLYSVTNGYFPHFVLLKFLKLLEYAAPGIFEWVVRRVMELNREKALRKYLR